MYAKKSEEKNQSTKTDPKLTQIIELTEKDIKLVIITNVKNARRKVKEC